MWLCINVADVQAASKKRTRDSDLLEPLPTSVEEVPPTLEFTEITDPEVRL